MAGYELVIFDCDGVLVDSERITNQVFAEMLNALGLHFTLEDMFEQFVGHSMAYCLEKISVNLGKALPEDFVASYRTRTTAALTANLVAVPGIEEALDQITLPYCVASNGDHEKMRTTLGLTGLWPRFEGKVFSGTEVKNPKPAPDIFLYAASKYSVAPGSCVVVEDTPTGVLAGIAAGMTVIGYAALTPEHRLRSAGAHYLIDNMNELPKLLQ